MTGLRLTNTYSKSLEPFEPLDPDRGVLMYSCGPTVYSYAHIGNFRSFLFADLLRRVLERNGYRVRQVMNITDVGHLTEDDVADAAGEDKLGKAAKQLGWDPYRVAGHFLEAFEQDASTLRLRNYGEGERGDALHPRATRFIPEMLAMIEDLITRGHAYTDSSGQVYFSIESFPEYGKLSGKIIEDLEVGSRVAVRSEKKDPRDFALWKVDTGHLMQWDPHSSEGWPEEDWARLQSLLPNGVRNEIKKGFPGWHIECSAMSKACLADAIDIHTGGEDNVFPHHECEIAQSCCSMDVTVPAADGTAVKNFAKYWVHGRHLLVDGRKMSKRDGTFFTVRNLLDPQGTEREDIADKLSALGFEDGKATGEDLRLSLLWGRYSQPMNYSLDLLARARKGRLRLQTLFERVSDLAGDGEPAEAIGEAADEADAQFGAALNDDLNMDKAMAIVFEFVGQMNSAELSAGDAARVLEALERFDAVLDVLVRRPTGALSSEDLAAWTTEEHRKARAEALSGWAEDDTRAPLHAALAAGEIPAPEALAALTAPLDAEAIDVVCGLRFAARKAKRWDVADAIRDQLKALGVTVEDSPDGVRWKLG